MNYFHSAASIAHKRQRPRRKERRKILPRSARQPHRLSMAPFQKRARTLLVRDATANFISSTPLRGRSCASVGGVWRVEEYQPYRRWKFTEWFWWPRNTPKTRRWHTGSTSCKRLDGLGASSGGKPHRNSSLSGNDSINSISIFNINSSS